MFSLHRRSARVGSAPQARGVAVFGVGEGPDSVGVLGEDVRELLSVGVVESVGKVRTVGDGCRGRRRGSGAIRKSSGRGVGTTEWFASAVIIPRVDSSDRPARASLSSRLTCATFKASASAAVVRPTAATGTEMVRSNSIRSAPGASS